MNDIDLTNHQEVAKRFCVLKREKSRGVHFGKIVGLHGREEEEEGEKSFSIHRWDAAE